MTNIEELEALLAKATPGVWEAEDNSCYCEIRADVGQIGDMCASCHVMEEGQDNRALSTANAQCVVALHNAAPALLEELKWLREALKIARPMMNRIDHNVGAYEKGIAAEELVDALLSATPAQNLAAIKALGAAEWLEANNERLDTMNQWDVQQEAARLREGK